MTDDVIADVRPGDRGVRWRRVAIVLTIILLAPGTWLARRAASRMEFFHLRSVSIEGTRYLADELVMQRLAVDTMRSVWDDTEPLAARVLAMPQVSGVTITRRLPGTLVVKIRENLPVALAPSPRGLEAVDTSGLVLPIDVSTADLDLPIANQRDRAILALLGGIRAENPMLYRRISEVSRDGRRGLVLQVAPPGGLHLAPDSLAAGDSAGLSSPDDPPTLRVRAEVGVSVSRLADIFPVESDLRRRRANVAELDLRYRDQVIARLQ